MLTRQLSTLLTAFVVAILSPGTAVLAQENETKLNIVVDSTGLSPTTPPEVSEKDVETEERIRNLRKDILEYRAKGETSNAIAACRTLLLIDRTHADTYADLGDLFAARGNAGEVERAYRLALCEYPNQTWRNSRSLEGDLHFRYALALLMLQDKDGAAKRFQIGLAALPKWEREAVLNKTSAEAITPNNKAAFEVACRQAIALRSINLRYWQNAEDQLSILEGSAPNDPLTLYCQGHRLYRKGEASNALAAWQRAKSGSNRWVATWVGQVEEHLRKTATTQRIPEGKSQANSGSRDSLR